MAITLKQIQEAVTEIVKPISERLTALESAPTRNVPLTPALVQTLAPPARTTGKGKAITGQVRASSTTKAIDAAPAGVVAGLQDATVLGLAGSIPAKSPEKRASKIKFMARCAAHSQAALHTYRDFGRMAANSFMGNEKATEQLTDAHRDGTYHVTTGTLAYLNALDTACFGSHTGTPAPSGKRVHRGRQGSAQGSPSRSPAQLANDKRLGEAARTRHEAARKA